MLRFENVTVDARDLRALSSWWCEALGWEKVYEDDDEVSVSTPGGNVDDMFRSLQALAALPGDPTVFPGHWYSAEPSAPLDDVRRTNYVYRARDLDQWRMLMGG